ncbi:unnamed protein product [Rhodiola kirilowii]
MLEQVVEDIADKLEGKLVVSLEDADWEKMKRSFKWALIVKLANGMSFNITWLGNVLSKVWNLELDKRVRFKELASNMAMAEFEYAADMVRVREGGPWLCLNTVALLHDWCPELAPEEIKMNRLGVWAQLHNLPIGAVMTDRDTGEKLAGYIGKFIKVDTEGAKKRFIRVRVEIDIDKPVITGFFLRRLSGDPIWISVKYERLPTLCPDCGRLGHEGDDCREEAEHSNQAPRNDRRSSQMVEQMATSTESTGKPEGRADERMVPMVQEQKHGEADRKSNPEKRVQADLREASARIDKAPICESLMEVEVRMATSEAVEACTTVREMQSWQKIKQMGGSKEKSNRQLCITPDGPTTAQFESGPGYCLTGSHPLKLGMVREWNEKDKSIEIARRKEEKLGRRPEKR